MNLDVILIATSPAAAVDYLAVTSCSSHGFLTLLLLWCTIHDGHSWFNTVIVEYMYFSELFP